MKQSLRELFRKIKKITSKPIMKVLPGQLAFFFVLSIIPLIYLVGLVGSFFSLSVNSFIDFIRESFPASTSNLIIPLIQGKGIDFSLLVFIFSAFYLASNGTNSIIITSNILYEIQDSTFLKRRIKAIIMTIMIVLLLGFVIIVPAFGNLILEAVKNLGFIKPIFEEVLVIFTILKLPISFIIIYFIIKLIYTIAPDKQIKSSESTYGAIFTTLCWIIATQAYSYYVSNFMRYDIFFGSIANLIILLLWIYLLSYIFVMGLALNATKIRYDVELKTKNDK